MNRTNLHLIGPHMNHKKKNIFIWQTKENSRQLDSTKLTSKFQTTYCCIITESNRLRIETDEVAHLDAICSTYSKHGMKCMPPRRLLHRREAAITRGRTIRAVIARPPKALCVACTACSAQDHPVCRKLNLVRALHPKTRKQPSHDNFPKSFRSCLAVVPARVGLGL